MLINTDKGEGRKKLNTCPYESFPAIQARYGHVYLVTSELFELSRTGSYKFS